MRRDAESQRKDKKTKINRQLAKTHRSAGTAAVAAARTGCFLEGWYDTTANCAFCVRATERALRSKVKAPERSVAAMLAQRKKTRV